MTEFSLQPAPIVERRHAPKAEPTLVSLSAPRLRGNTHLHHCGPIGVIHVVLLGIILATMPVDVAGSDVSQRQEPQAAVGRIRDVQVQLVQASHQCICQSFLSHPGSLAANLRPPSNPQLTEAIHGRGETRASCSVPGRRSRWETVSPTRYGESRMKRSKVPAPPPLEGWDELSGPDEQLIVDLEKLVLPHHEKELEIRFEMGKRLNQHFGEPPNLQEHGGFVLEKASQRLDTSTSDLSRMRWFAHHFTSFSEFQQKHPTIKTWAPVKLLIPQLNRKPGAKVKTAEKSSQRIRKEVLATLKQLKENLPKITNDDFTIGELVAAEDAVAAIATAINTLSAKVRAVGTESATTKSAKAESQPVG